ncbi:MAG: YceI family protein [Bacteroidetes bacterium]|nr:YceI family protein [Bacteroidota bacterium]
MKNIIKTVTLMAVLAFILVSFTAVEKKEIKLEKSKIAWKGYKVTGSHEGTLTFKSGYLIFNKSKLSGGQFIVDMTSLVCTDLSGEYKEKLEGHLKSDDFFGVEKFNTASLIITKVKSTGKNTYSVVANLTIKGKTNPVSFDISVVGNRANAALKVDRTKYDIRYGSASFFDNLQDKAINNDFDLVVDLEF